MTRTRNVSETQSTSFIQASRHSQLQNKRKMNSTSSASKVGDRTFSSAYPDSGTLTALQTLQKKQVFHSPESISDKRIATENREINKENWTNNLARSAGQFGAGIAGLAVVLFANLFGGRSLSRA